MKSPKTPVYISFDENFSNTITPPKEPPKTGHDFEFSIDPREWKWGKEQEEEAIKQGKTDFKIQRKKAPSSQSYLMHSFLSVTTHNGERKLLCLAPQSQYLQKKNESNHSKVKLASSEDGQIYVVKIIEKNKEIINSNHLVNSNEDEEIIIEKDLGIYYGGLIRDSGADKDKNKEKEYQVKEYLGQDLISFLERNQLSSEQQLELAHSILLALKNIHQRNIIHRDLHPRNICVKRDKEGHLIASIIDFGKSKKLKEGENEIPWKRGETIYWRILAPEVGYMDKDDKLKRGAHPFFNRETDIFALGLIFENQLKMDPMIVAKMKNADLHSRPSIDEIATAIGGPIKKRQSFVNQYRSIQHDPSAQATIKLENDDTLSITSDLKKHDI